MSRFLMVPVLLLFLSTASQAQQTSASWPTLKSRITGALARNEVDVVIDSILLLTPYDTPEVSTFILKYLLPHDDLLVHEEAFQALSRMKELASQKVVIDTALSHKHWEMRASCVRVIASYDGEYPVSKIEQALDDKKWQVRSSAIRALGTKRRLGNIPLLIERLKTEPGRLRQDIVWSLGQLTGMRFQAVHGDWASWWAANSADFVMPSLKKVKADLEDAGPKKLKTAVAEGLYGRIYSEKIAFLFDVSGSMGVGTDMQGTRAEIAYRELIRVIENDLTPKTYFNVVAFAATVMPFKQRLVKNRPAAVKKARTFLKNLPVGGETNVFGALEQAFSDPDVDTIILLSDGVPTVGEESIPEVIIQQVDEWNRHRKVIINCIGFFPGDAKHQDKAEARHFLRKLARKNEGFYHEIY